MKNKINHYFFHQFSRYFVVVLFALTSIIWIVQAVNFLDLVIEDGHAFTVYFSYSLLSIPKIVTRIIPFSFMVSLLLTILKLEKDNEMIIMWTSGLNKIKIVNLIFFISIMVMIVQLVMASTVAPASLNLSRSILKSSSLEFFPNLIKEKQFNDTIEEVTFFVEKKTVDGKFQNIFIRDNNKILYAKNQKSSTIFAESGFIKQDKKSRHLILFNGTIQKESLNGKINFIKFSKTALSLRDLTGKTIVRPKIQETSSLKLLQCKSDSSSSYLKFFIELESFFYTFSKNKDINMSVHNCDKNNKTLMIELNRRFGMPFYIPILALIGSFLLSSKQKSKMSAYNKLIYFFIGFFILVFAEIYTRYSAYTYIYYLIPIVIIPIVYLVLLKTFKYENMTS